MYIKCCPPYKYIYNAFKTFVHTTKNEKQYLTITRFKRNSDNSLQKLWVHTFFSFFRSINPQYQEYLEITEGMQHFKMYFFTFIIDTIFNRAVFKYLTITVFTWRHQHVTWSGAVKVWEKCSFFLRFLKKIAVFSGFACLCCFAYANERH